MKQYIFCLLLICLAFSVVFAQKAAKRPANIGDGFVLQFNSPFDRILIDTDEKNMPNRLGSEILVTPQTRILNHKGKPVEAGAIRPGMEVEIRLNTDLSASQIKMRTNPENWEMEVDGYLDRFNGDEGFIDGQAVALAPNVSLPGIKEWKGKSFSSLKDIPLGSLLDLKGVRQPNGIVLVKQGEVRPNLFTAVESKLVETVQKGLVLPPNGQAGAAVQIGNKIYKLSDNLELNGYVNKVGNRVAPRYLRNLSADDPNKILFRFYVVEDDTANAFAFPDGSVFIHTGMLRRMENESQLALVIGHEIAHVTNEHSRRSLETAQQQAFWLGLAGAAGGQLGMLVAQIGYGLLQNKFSRDMEDQADRVGIYYAWEAGYDVREAPRLWRRMMGEYSESRVGAFLYSDHPSMLSRYRNTNRMMVFNYANSDFSEVETGRERYMKTVGAYFGWIEESKPTLTRKTTQADNPKSTVPPKTPKTQPTPQMKPPVRVKKPVVKKPANTPQTTVPNKITTKTNTVKKPANTVAARGIRAINFRNFKYPVSQTCKDEVKGGFAKVVNGKIIVARDKDYGPQGFEVTKILYGDLTGDGQEEAVISTVCGNLEPPGISQSGFGNTYVYTMESEKLKLLTLFDENSIEPQYKSFYNEETFLFGGGAVKVLGSRLYYGAMVMEGMCCPKWNVEMILRWNGYQFVLDGRPQRTPWQ
jgi:hypothetical protein